MQIIFDPVLDEERQRDVIPELDSDPSSPQPESSWVLKTTTGGTGAGEAFGFLAYTNPGVGGSTSYSFKYRTLEGTTVSVDLT